MTCLLGIVLITAEYRQQTATTTFPQTPRRTRALAGRLGTAVVDLRGAARWTTAAAFGVVQGCLR